MAAEGAAGPRKGRPHRRNGGVDGLEPMLGRLAENPARLTASGLWKALRPDERALAAEYFLEDKGTDRNALVTMVALTRRARPETVRKWSNAKLAGGMKTAFSLEAKLASSLLEQLHMTGRRAMLGRFLDLLGARSREGLPDSADKIAAKEHEVHAAADRLMAEYGVHNVVVYFLVLALRRASVADHLWSWMRRLGNGKAPEAAVAEQGAASQAGVVDASPPPSSRAARTARSRASGTTSVRASRIPPSGARGAKPGRASGTKLDRGLAHRPGARLFGCSAPRLARWPGGCLFGRPAPRLASRPGGRRFGCPAPRPAHRPRGRLFGHSAPRLVRRVGACLFGRPRGRLFGEQVALARRRGPSQGRGGGRRLPAAADLHDLS